MRYGWGSYEVNLSTRQVLADAEVVHIEPTAFDVLQYLIENRGRVVRKNDLLDDVWDSRFVSESAMTTAIKSARRAVGDSGTTQHTIRTAHGAGYQFVEPDDFAVSGDGIATPQRTLIHAPAARTTFHGRSGEIEALEAKARPGQLITLLGPGGVGKTRLCVQWATSSPDVRLPVFVDLAEVSEPEAVVSQVALALSIQSTDTDLLDAIGEFLSAEPQTVILDNCEHVTEAAAVLVNRIFELAPTTTIVATSRRRLNVVGESVLRIEPLPADWPTGAAVGPAAELFLARAELAAPGVELDPREVDHICKALDGLPLALELAASRLGAFELGEIISRLDQRLDFASQVPGEQRHRSLRAALGWSYEVLATDEQRLFTVMATFPGGVSLACTEWLSDQLGLPDALGPLTRLVDLSLVTRTSVATGSWYDQLESMRTFALERLAESEDAELGSSLAVDWALRIAAEMSSELAGPKEIEWNSTIRDEFANIREARRLLRAAGDDHRLVELLVMLTEWGRARDVSELWDWADGLVVAADRLPPTQRARALTVAAEGPLRRGHLAQARGLAEQAQAVAEDDGWVEVHATSVLATAVAFGGDPAAGIGLWRRRVEIDGYIPDRSNIAVALAMTGQLDEALRTVDRALAEATDADWGTAIAHGQYATGEVLARQDNAGAITWLSTAVETAASVGASFVEGIAGVTLARLKAEAGDAPGAAAQHRDLIAFWLRANAWTPLWLTLLSSAALLEPTDPDLAAAIAAGAAADPDAPRIDAVDSGGTDGLADGTVNLVDRPELARRTIAALALLE